MGKTTILLVTFLFLELSSAFANEMKELQPILEAHGRRYDLESSEAAITVSGKYQAQKYKTLWSFSVPYLFRTARDVEITAQSGDFLIEIPQEEDLSLFFPLYLLKDKYTLVGILQNNGVVIKLKDAKNPHGETIKVICEMHITFDIPDDIFVHQKVIHLENFTRIE